MAHAELRQGSAGSLFTVAVTEAGALNDTQKKVAPGCDRPLMMGWPGFRVIERRVIGETRGQLTMHTAPDADRIEPGSGLIPAETLEFIQNVRERVGTVVVGQDVVVERLLVALFTGGHLLLQGVPGLAKTLLVAVLSKTIDLH